MHPLADNLADLKDAELESKILSLSKKYWQTRNSDVQFQIRMLLDVYNDELRNRRSKILQQQLENRNTDLDNLIKVN